MPVSAIARTLFALNRQQSLAAIAASAPPLSEYHRLASDLRHPLDPGKPAAPSCSQQSWLAACLHWLSNLPAPSGWPPASGREGFGQIARLTTGVFGVRIYAVEPLDRKHRAWVTLASLLQKTLGSLYFRICHEFRPDSRVRPSAPGTA